MYSAIRYANAIFGVFKLWLMVKIHHFLQTSIEHLPPSSLRYVATTLAFMLLVTFFVYTLKETVTELLDLLKPVYKDLVSFIKRLR
jgi:hypothetical protein